MLVETSERKRRMAICKNCEHLRIAYFIRRAVERCGQCGCLILFRASLGCPVGKF